jgi:hypothetical protein
MARALRAATAAQIVKGLEATNGPSEVPDLLSHYAPADDWTQTAYLSMCQRRGSAALLYVTRRADLMADGSIDFDGTYGNVNNLPFPGVHADFWIEQLGIYACTVRMARGRPLSEPFGVYEFGLRTYQVDPRSLGTLEIGSSQPENFTFLVRLEPAGHSIDVRPTTHVGFTFYSLTVTRIPELAPA